MCVIIPYMVKVVAGDCLRLLYGFCFGELSICENSKCLHSVQCKFNLEAMQSIRALIKSAFFRARFSIYGQTAV